MMRPTLITVLYNSAEALPDFMASLHAQDHDDWRLLAVDNASADGSASALAALADERTTLLRNGTNLGFARAVNQALSHAASDENQDLFILINNDTTFGPDFLTKLLAARDRLGADVIAPRIMRMNDPNESWYAGGAIERDWVLRSIHHKHDPADLAEHRIVSFATGCCLGLTRNVLQRVGLLDESFFVYWEDTDFCLRLEQAGVPIHYVRDPVLLHHVGASSGGAFSPSFTRLYYKGQILLVRKYCGLGTAVRCCVRLLANRLSHPERQKGDLKAMLLAMLSGLVFRLRETPRLVR